VRRVKALVVVLAAGAGLGSCGGSDDTEQAPDLSSDQRAILQTIDALQSASREGDAERICDQLLTRTLAHAIRASSGQSCEAEVRETLTAPDAQLSVARRIEINGARATATVREQSGNTSTLSLVKDGERWRINRIRPVES
jgi:hypothetical protein